MVLIPARDALVGTSRHSERNWPGVLIAIRPGSVMTFRNIQCKCRRAGLTAIRSSTLSRLVRHVRTQRSITFRDAATCGAPPPRYSASDLRRTALGNLFCRKTWNRRIAAGEETQRRHFTRTRLTHPACLAGENVRLPLSSSAPLIFVRPGCDRAGCRAAEAGDHGSRRDPRRLVHCSRADGR